ncbi:MAG: hypothetical protein JRN20_17470 [Nitrososphaerota archaeon]|nr:hypothetical protein [Nitrososphaerota archaeon]MDG6924091.1 hypothetical protein [Nitrososphaerota archaeon]
MSNLATLLKHQGYNVKIANTTQQELSFASTSGVVFFLISPDSPISSSTAQTLFSRYQRGELSLVLAEANSTNEAPLLSAFGANVTGAAINDTTSSFSDQRIFDITMNLGSVISGEIDIGSPIILKNSILTPVAESPASSIDSRNSTLGQRTVIAATSSASSSRAILVSSPSPFTNCGLGQCTNLNDTSLVLSMTNWASAGNTSRPIVIDGSLYTPTIPPVGLGIPVGWIMLQVLKGTLSSFGGANLSQLSSSSSGFSLFGFTIPKIFVTLIQLAIALLLLYIIRGRIRAWFATEKPVKDDQPLPVIEKDIVSESKEKVDFLTMSRSKSFYVATLAQLYEVIDDVARLELGAGTKDLSMETLNARLGPEKATRAYKNLQELSKYYDYANSKGRFLLPPGLSWKRKVNSMTTWAEQFLNDLGMTMAGKVSEKQLEYALKR